MRKRVKVEFQDGNGNKYTLAVEGKISRDKVMKIMDVMELMEMPVEELGEKQQAAAATNGDTTTSYGKIHKLIQESFSAIDFSSSDVAREYEEKFGEMIALSTVSTYLTRMYERGNLKRQKFGNSWVYRKTYVPVGVLPTK